MHRAYAAEVCTRVQLKHVDIDDDHGMKCLQTAQMFSQLVRDSGLQCAAVVSLAIDRAKHQYFVTCFFVDITRRADQAEQYANYRSVDGRVFFP